MTGLEHARTGAHLTVPTDWEVAPTATDEVGSSTAAALEPPRTVGGRQAFRANLVLTAVDTGLDFRQWQVNTDVLLPEVLTDYLLLDLETLTVAGRPGGRRLARYVGPGGVDLTMEQWFTLVDGTGITVTATVDTWRYDDVADELAAHARTLALPAAVEG